MCKRWWWVFLVTAPIGAVCGLLVASVVTFLMPKAYESQAVIEVRPAPGELFSCEAEVKKIEEPELLGRVVAKLELDTIWKMPRQAVIKCLGGKVKCARVGDTNRIAISARLANSFEAKDTVNELAAAFKIERERFPEILAKRVADLDRQAVAQFDKLEDMTSKWPGTGDGGTPNDWRKASSRDWPELVTERLKYEALTTELEAATSEAKAQSAAVILCQAGVAQHFPVSPNIRFNLDTGKMLGFLLSPLLALLVVRSLHRRFPPPSADPSGDSTAGNENGQVG